MTVHHEAQERRAIDIYGLRPSRANACPRVVAGRRCVAYNDERRLCICQTYRRLLDHGRMWLDESGRHVLTGEPYDIDTAELVEFIGELDRVGLAVTVGARSLWNPGQCVLIRVLRPAAVVTAVGHRENCGADS